MTGAGRQRTAPSGIAAVLAQARAGLARVSAEQAFRMLQDGALLVDTRTESQRRRDGEIPGATVVDRTVLEWRLDPSSPHRLDNAGDYDDPVVVICSEGYSSSLAAESLQRLGRQHATDVIGGFQAWRLAGLPVEPSM